MTEKPRSSLVSVVPGPHVPFNRPLHLGGEGQAIQTVLESGHLSGGGPFARRCEQWMRDHSEVAGALMVSSCTHALEMSAMLANIGPGDEVIMPAYTFVSTANAFVMRGAVPVFVDIRADTCNIDETLIEDAITPSTRAIVPVHYAGVSCDMSAIMETARHHNLTVIEDAAHAVMASWRGRALGSIGHMGAYSFHETKNYTSGGEGGMLLISQRETQERAEVIREKGTDRAKFMRGEVPEYVWQECGSSYLASEIQAAALSVQLQDAKKVNQRRLSLWSRYYDTLELIAKRNSVRLPTVPEGCCHNGHIFYLVFPSVRYREAVQASLASAGIVAQTHYRPLHLSPAGKRHARFFGDDTNTLEISERILRLPLYYALSDEDQSLVIDVLITALDACA